MNFNLDFSSDQVGDWLIDSLQRSFQVVRCRVLKYLLLVLSCESPFVRRRIKPREECRICIDPVQKFDF